jgi:hypothetical protein
MRHVLEIHHTPGLFCRLRVNDIEMYSRVVDYNACPRTPITHVLAPGENRFDLEVEKGPPNPLQPNSTPIFEAFVLRDDGSGLVDDEKVVHQMSFPELLEGYPVEERKLPFRHQERFLMPDDQLEPVWWRSGPEDFPPEGTLDQQHAVRRLYDAFAAKDLDGFLAATRSKLDLHRRTYGEQAETTPVAARAKVNAMLSQPWDMRPLVMDDLVFARRGDGRVAQVSHKDGSPALLARHRVEPSQSWGASVWLARVDGEWNVIW